MLRGTVTDGFQHDPIMVAEILDVFAPVPAGVVVDATLGGAGHSQAILDARSDLSIVGLDQDRDALRAAGQRLGAYGERATLVHCRFDDIGAQLQSLGHDDISGFLFDLGVSSPQIDRPERGFSYRFDGPLDMRMDASAGVTAAQVVNTYPEHELARVLRDLGDEKNARRIAKAIVAARPLDRTDALAEVVREATPARDRRRGDPAKRTFQALRIEVNRELDILPTAIEQAIDHLAVGGRGAVLAYHSGEDRIVKDCFWHAAGLDRDPRLPELEPPACSLLWRKGRAASDEEQERNPRSTSARLRAIERQTAVPSRSDS